MSQRYNIIHMNLPPYGCEFDDTPITTDAYFRPALTDEEASDALWCGRLPYTIRPSSSFPGYYTLMYKHPSEKNIQKITIMYVRGLGFVPARITSTRLDVAYASNCKTVQELVECRQKI